MRIILVTKAGCPACTHFLAGPWPSLKDRLSYAIGGAPVEHIDVARDGIDKVPTPIRRQLQFVPWIYALYDDGTVEPTKNSINSPAGLRELEEWATNGPPKYASSPPPVINEDDSLPVDDGPRLEVVAVTSTSCGFCAMWESSGGLKRFLDGLKDMPVDRSHYNITNSQPTNQDDIKRRMALSGIPGLPSVVVVNHEKWLQPTAKKLQKTDVMLSPGEARTPQGVAILKKWLSMMLDKKQKFLGYLVLTTNTSCGYCVEWKRSGDMDVFLQDYGSLPGIFLINSEIRPGKQSDERFPKVMESQMRTIPTPAAFFVPAESWNSDSPEVIVGPDVRNPAAFSKWIEGLTQDQVQWKNDPDYTPPSYQAATAARMKSRPPQVIAPRRPPMSRQGFR